MCPESSATGTPPASVPTARTEPAELAGAVEVDPPEFDEDGAVDDREPVEPLVGGTGEVDVSVAAAPVPGRTPSPAAKRGAS